MDLIVRLGQNGHLSLHMRDEIMHSVEKRKCTGNKWGVPIGGYEKRKKQGPSSIKRNIWGKKTRC